MTNKSLPESTKALRLNLPFAANKWAACLILFISARGADPGASPTPDPIDQKIQDLMDKSNRSTPAMVEAAREGYQLGIKS
jgi:hypothetical protein